MKRFVTGSAVAITIALSDAALAQDQQLAASGEGTVFVAWTAEDLFVTQVFGIAVMAPETGSDGLSMDDFDADQGFTVDRTELAGYQYVGRVTDMMLGRAGETRALVVARLGDTPGEIAGIPADADPELLQVPRAAQMPLPGTTPEVAIGLDRIVFLSDATVPELTFALLDISLEQFYSGPTIARGPTVHADAGPTGEAVREPGLRTGWQEGWHAGREMMTPPTLVTPGFASVPATEVSVDDLMGAPLYGSEHEHIGNIGDVVVGPEHEVSYVTVDIGGFLGIGARQVAIGFDEITILRDVNVDDLEVHISATREMLEDMPEYPR